MRKELDYFTIESAYGGDQDWFPDHMMRLGGCGAVTACDSCLYFDLYKGTKLYPYELKYITKEDYIRFGMLMKPYLRPRWSGIDTLQLYMDGFGKYLSDQGCGRISMRSFSGHKTAVDAKARLKGQIDRGYPVPCLLLKHKDSFFKDYEWHWFLLTGYDEAEGACMVKAVTYGEFQWLPLEQLWETGYPRKGGFVLYGEEKYDQY